jgi:hypothetical protein
MSLLVAARPVIRVAFVTDRYPPFSPYWARSGAGVRRISVLGSRLPAVYSRALYTGRNSLNRRRGR